MQPIILIGPARSGTKILRDTIATHPSINKVGFDINFIWKKGNEEVPHDCLEPEQARPEVSRFIRKYFQQQAGKAPFLIEKTVSNALRIPFVLKVFPEAKFIFLYRDGRDTVESVTRQWGMAPDKSYLWKKLLSVPVLEVLPYILKYGFDLVKIKLGLKPTESYVWGVKFKGFEECLNILSTIDFCSEQWNHCIDCMQDHQKLIAPENLLTIRYEEMVGQLENTFTKIANFLFLDPSFDLSLIDRNTTGLSKKGLSESAYAALTDQLRENLIRLEYPISDASIEK